MSVVSTRISLVALVVAVACGIASVAPAQQPAGNAQQPAAARAYSPQFAPGVLTTIPATVEPAEAVSVHDLVEIRSHEDLQWKPTTTGVSRTLYEMAKDVPFTQEVWALELTFKPLRMIEANVADRQGRLQRRNIWYMVYRVRNTGAGLAPVLQKDGEFKTESQAIEGIRFIPQFVLDIQDRDGLTGKRVRKAYLDRIVPGAMEAISQREFNGQRLLTSVEMAEQLLSVEKGRAAAGAWGVAMWENVDASTDFFSVYVSGLSNAYRWSDTPGAYKVGDAPGKGRQFTRKTLQLNFWRPGDRYEQDEREIRLGVPRGKASLYAGSGEGETHRWVYR